MTQKEILHNIAVQHGVDKLNPMQIAVKDSNSSHKILLAPTGSGKTIAFTIPLLKTLSKPTGAVQAIVIAPSRELVVQIAEVIRPVASGLKTAAFYGGHSMQDEINTLSSIPDIIVATPGRLLDHLQRVTLSLYGVHSLVIDEYDKSLELGFLNEMRRIIRHTGKLSFIMLTSATPITELPDFLPMRDAEVIDFSDTAKATGKLIHVAKVESPVRDKLDTLVGLLRSIPNGRTMVFVNHRESAERVYSRLLEEDMPAGLYHGGLDQQEREIALELLENATTPILVSTDLGSRGLDIEDVRTIIHYHLPPSAENWTHRNGRTARMGAGGSIYVITSETENIPQYVTWDNDYFPGPSNPDPIRSEWATLHFNAGKKEKLSRGDIAGFMMQKGNLGKDEVGKITVKDHYGLVAVPRKRIKETLSAVASQKIKNMRVRITIIKSQPANATK